MCVSIGLLCVPFAWKFAAKKISEISIHANRLELN